MAEDRTDIERSIRELVEGGDIDGATTLAVKEYGPELHSFLCALARDPARADEAFSDMIERLWKGLAKFRWEATVRTWAYQLARHALHAVRRDPRARVERNLPLSVVTSMAAVPRTSTAPFARSSVKSEIRQMIEALDPDDYELMVLRLDQGMAWKDIARATADDELDGTALDQRAAACRKRYERIKEQLRVAAAQRGLIDGGVP